MIRLNNRSKISVSRCLNHASLRIKSIRKNVIHNEMTKLPEINNKAVNNTKKEQSNMFVLRPLDVNKITGSLLGYDKLINNNDPINTKPYKSLTNLKDNTSKEVLHLRLIQKYGKKNNSKILSFNRERVYHKSWFCKVKEN